MWTRSAGRTSGTPRTGPASTRPQTPGRAAPSVCRSADTGCADRFRSCAGILYDSLVIPAIVLAAGKSTRMGRPKVVDRPGVVAVLMTLVDVPLVNAATVRAVIDRYHQTHAPIVRPVQGDQHGHPVLIDRKLFDAFRHADPATGAKPIIRANVSLAGDVVVDDT